MAVIKDLGAVTAYASAVEGGYTGTKAEFETLMASYASVAEEAAESAESASQSAEGASASATTATSKASEASTSATQAGASATSASQSAQTATAKASEASASATQAGTKASEASASATTASSKASEASASATSAQTAQGLAESARDDAVDAKTDAESARDLAQQYAESIDPEKIYSAYPTDTASGSVASFADGADDIPMKSVKVAIEPVQDLHGYDHPWPAGGGKNILPTPTQESQTISGITVKTNADGSITFSGTASSAISINFVFFDLPAGNYIFSNIGSNAASSGATTSVYVRDNTNGVTLTSFSLGNSASNYDFTLTETANIRFYAVVQNGATVSGTFYPMIRRSGDGDNTYVPYSNICPISGWTGAQVSHSGADTSDPTTYPITFPTEAGTVYGGELDVTNGTLTVDRAGVDLGTLVWQFDNTVFYTSSAPLFGLGGSALVNNTVIFAENKCEIYKSDVVTLSNTVNGRFFVTNSQATPILRVSDDRFSDAASFKTAMDGVMAIFKLKESVVYTLTPTEIKSLLGDNNVWADAGDATVEYRADTVMYIDKKLGKDAPMIATDNIVSGSYFMVGNNLYKATANIASGAAVVVGTNATAKTMAEALNEINA